MVQGKDGKESWYSLINCWNGGRRRVQKKQKTHARDKGACEDSVIGEDFRQDNPAEGAERVESGTTPHGMERATKNNCKSDINPGKTATNIIVHIKFFRKGKM